MTRTSTAQRGRRGLILIVRVAVLAAAAESSTCPSLTCRARRYRPLARREKHPIFRTRAPFLEQHNFYNRAASLLHKCKIASL